MSCIRICGRAYHHTAAICMLNSHWFPIALCCPVNYAVLLFLATVFSHANNMAVTQLWDSTASKRKKAQNLKPNINLRVSTKSRRHHPCSSSSPVPGLRRETRWRRKPRVPLLSILQWDSVWFYPKIGENKNWNFPNFTHPPSRVHMAHTHMSAERKFSCTAFSFMSTLIVLFSFHWEILSNISIDLKITAKATQISLTCFT